MSLEAKQTRDRLAKQAAEAPQMTSTLLPVALGEIVDNIFEAVRKGAPLPALPNFGTFITDKKFDIAATTGKAEPSAVAAYDRVARLYNEKRETEREEAIEQAKILDGIINGIQRETN